MIPRSGQNLGTGPVPWGKNDKIAESSTLGQYISTPKISECLRTLIVCFPQPRMNTVLIWRYHSFWFCQDITPKLTVWRDTGRTPQKKPSKFTVLTVLEAFYASVTNDLWQQNHLEWQNKADNDVKISKIQIFSVLRLFLTASNG